VGGMLCELRLQRTALRIPYCTKRYSITSKSAVWYSVHLARTLSDHVCGLYVRTAQILKGNLLIGEWDCSAAERPRTAG